MARHDRASRGRTSITLNALMTRRLLRRVWEQSAYAEGLAGQRRWTKVMAATFKVGDHVSWNSEAGRVRGRIVRVHREDLKYKGYVHHASPDEPQYEIKSDKTDHIALHKGRALRRLSR
jgi:hypothetical protein